MINRADHIGPASKRDEALLAPILLWLPPLLLTLLLLVAVMVLLMLVLVVAVDGSRCCGDSCKAVIIQTDKHH